VLNRVLADGRPAAQLAASHAQPLREAAHV
jgi:hypothetical protein